MLHASELERRHEQEVELAPGVRNAGVAFEPGERRGVQVEDRIAVPRDFCRVGLAMEHPKRAAPTFGGLDRESSGGKREEVRGQRLGFRKRQADPAVGLAASRLDAVGDRHPPGGHVQTERPARLQIRLIETGERPVCPCRHEECVEEIRMAIERVVAGDEIDEDLVPTLAQIFRGEHDVIGDDRRRDRLGAQSDAAHPFGRREVERQRASGVLQHEGDRHTSGHPRVLAGGDRDLEVVAEIADAARALFREGQRDARSRVVERLHG